MRMTKLGYPDYSVSSLGRVRNEKTGNILEDGHTSGYRSVSLVDETGYRTTDYVHRLVLRTFKGEAPSPDMTVDHINRDRLDNRLSNLQWATRKTQATNSEFSEASIGYKCVEQRSLDGTLIKVWNSRKEAAEALKIDAKRISDAIMGVKDGNIYQGFIWTNPPVDIKEGEIWKPCIDPNFAGFFVSSFGRIKTKAGKITYGAESNGYKMASTYVSGIRTTRKVHCLVAEAFLGVSDLLVNHKDGNKANNHLDNLEYVTYRENAQHAHDIGLHPGPPKRPIVQYTKEGIEIARFDSIREAKQAIVVGDITSTLSGRTKTAGGFVWKYADK